MAKLAKTITRITYADICAPAAIYLFVGLLVIAIDFSYFASSLVKTTNHFFTIVIKLIVIFLVTIVLNYFCKANLFWLSAILAAITSVYLLAESFRMIQEKKRAAPYSIPPPYIHPPTLQSPQLQYPTQPPVTSLSSAQLDTYLLDKIVPTNDIIGLNSRDAK